LALCTQLDVEQKLQWDITAEPDTTVTALIADAQAHIEAEVGRTLEGATRSETFDGGRAAIALKYVPVTAISSVSENGDVLTVDDDYIWNERGRLMRVTTGGYQKLWATHKPQSIVVDYDGGFVSPDHDTELEHLGSICAEVVARAFRKGAQNASIPADAAGSVQSVTLDGRGTVSYATGGGGTATLEGGLSQFVFLVEDERRQLLVYKRVRFGIA
jgi:hypothetical protein